MNLDSKRLEQFVVGIKNSEKMNNICVESIKRWGINEFIDYDIISSNRELSFNEFYCKMKEKYQDKHLILVYRDLAFPETFIEDLNNVLYELDNRNLEWGILSNHGISYPNFLEVKNICNEHIYDRSFPFTLPAVSLSDDFLIINKNFELSINKDYQEYYDHGTLFCIDSWKNDLPAFIIDIPIYKIENVNASEITNSNDCLKNILIQNFNNRIIKTLHSEISLENYSKDKPDFYKDILEKKVKEMYSDIESVKVNAVVRTTGKRFGLLRKSLFSIALQVTKPDKVKLILSTTKDEIISRVKKLISNYDKYFDWELIVNNDSSPASRITSLNKYFGMIENESENDSVSFFLDDDDYIFPNYVKDIKETYKIFNNNKNVILIFDFCKSYQKLQNINVFEGQTKEVWFTYKKERYEPIDNIFEELYTNYIPFIGLVFPDKNLYGFRYNKNTIYLEDYSLILEQLKRKKFFFFLRKNGGEVSIRQNSDNVVTLEDKTNWILSRSLIYQRYLFQDKANAFISGILASNKHSKHVEPEQKSSEKGSNLFAKLYINTGEGFCEEKSIQTFIKQKRNVLTFDLSDYEFIKNFRFDPLNKMTKFKIYEAKIIYKDLKEQKLDVSDNLFHKHNGFLYFSKSDPHIYFDFIDFNNPYKLIIKIKYFSIGIHTYKWLAEIKDQQLIEKDNIISKYKNSMDSKSNKIIKKPFKYIKNVFKSFLMLYL